MATRQPKTREPGGNLLLWLGDNFQVRCYFFALESDAAQRLRSEREAAAIP